MHIHCCGDVGKARPPVFRRRRPGTANDQSPNASKSGGDAADKPRTKSCSQLAGKRSPIPEVRHRPQRQHSKRIPKRVGGSSGSRIWRQMGGNDGSASRTVSACAPSRPKPPANCVAINPRGNRSGPTDFPAFRRSAPGPSHPTWTALPNSARRERRRCALREPPARANGATRRPVGRMLERLKGRLLLGEFRAVDARVVLRGVAQEE
jgi:hypothetical protein